MRRTTIVFVSFLLFYNYCYSTPQAPDLMIYKGDTIGVYPFILQEYIRKHPNKEAFYEEKRDLRKMSFGCWRGFISLFEVRNDSLYLVKAYGEKDVDLSLIFGKKGNIFVSWVSDTLTSPEKNLLYDHNHLWAGYYEYETDFVFEKGILKNVKKYKNQIRPSVYTQRNDTLSKFIKANINYKSVPSPKERIRVAIRIEDVDSDGKITKVKVIRGHEGYDEEAVRVIKSIPRWETIVRRGKKIHRHWMIPIVFEP